MSRLDRALEYYRLRRKKGDAARAAEGLISLAALALVLAGELEPAEDVS